MHKATNTKQTHKFNDYLLLNAFVTKSKQTNGAGDCLWPLSHFQATVYVYPECSSWAARPLPWWWTNVKSFLTRMCQCKRRRTCTHRISEWRMTFTRQIENECVRNNRLIDCLSRIFLRNACTSFNNKQQPFQLQTKMQMTIQQNEREKKTHQQKLHGIDAEHMEKNRKRYDVVHSNNEMQI